MRRRNEKEERVKRRFIDRSVLRRTEDKWDKTAKD